MLPLRRKLPLEHSILLSGLSSKRDLWISRTTSIIEQQLRQQGSHSSNSYRYEVALEIVEGRRRPATDVDNYAKKILDAITRTGLLWHDDKQIDILIVRRRRERSGSLSQVEIRINRIEGQHSGVPTFFHACCHEASSGHQYTYAHPGYHLAIHLSSQQPYDLAEVVWAEKVKQLCSFLDKSDNEGAWNWFCEHFPKCMKLVPKRRMDQFIAGVVQAYEDRRIEQ
jgi:Holliday junction resolvase RusA-like endonuclease